MRRILATSLLLPSLILPAVAIASTPVDDATAPTPIRVSTGVIFPNLSKRSTLQLLKALPAAPSPATPKSASHSPWTKGPARKTSTLLSHSTHVGTLVSSMQ